MQVRILQITIIFVAVFAINSISGLLKADIHKKKGKESLSKGFPYIAVNEFNKTIKLDSSDGEARGYLGIAYTNLAERNKDREFLIKAVYEIKNALKTHEDPTINYHLANAYELSGDIDNAIQEAIKSYNQIPLEQTKDKVIKLYKIKGDMLLSQNKRDEAIKFYSKFVELKGVNVANEDTSNYEFLRNLIPDNFFIRYNLAQLYKNQNQWEKMVSEFEYIKKSGISNEDIVRNLIYAYYNLGNKYLNEKKFGEADKYLNLALNLDNINQFGYTFSAINSLAALYEQVGNIDKAVEIWMKLESFDTYKGQGYYQIGHLYNRKSNPQKAIEYYEKYLPFKPVSDVGIFGTLGYLYEQVGNIDKAVKIYSKLEDINYTRGSGHYSIGLLYEKKEKWNDALKEFEYVLKIRPEDSQILIKIGQVYGKMGNSRKALEIYRKVITLNPLKEAELIIPMVRLYEKIGEREKAASLLKRSRT